MFDGRNSAGDLAAIANINPLQNLMEISFASRNGYRRGLRWLCIFASSGVDIPVSAFFQFAAFVGKFQADLEDCLLLTKAVLYSAWLRSIGRQDLQAVLGMLHDYLSPMIVPKIWQDESYIEA